MEINRETVLASLEKAVAEKGEDFVYEQPDERLGDSCTYIHQGATPEEDVPGCIWGHVLLDLGVDKELLKSKDRRVQDGDAVGIGMGIWAVLEALKVDDTDLLRAADNAQSIQDNGGTWGTALHEYKYRMGQVED